MLHTQYKIICFLFLEPGWIKWFVWNMSFGFHLHRGITVGETSPQDLRSSVPINTAHAVQNKMFSYSFPWTWLNIMVCVEDVLWFSSGCITVRETPKPSLFSLFRPRHRAEFLARCCCCLLNVSHRRKWTLVVEEIGIHSNRLRC